MIISILADHQVQILSLSHVLFCHSLVVNMAVPMLKQLAAAAIVAQFLGLASAAVLPLQARDGEEPGLPHASDTTPYCSWWADYDGSQTCEEVIDFNWIDLKSFYRWVRII